MFFLAVMVVTAVVGAKSESDAAAAQGEAERGNIEQQMYNQRVQRAFNENTLTTDLMKSEMDFKTKYIERLGMYNNILDQQMVSAGYKGTTVNTNMQAADKDAWERDNQMDTLNAELSAININLRNTQTNLGMAQDANSAEAALAASRTAQHYAQQGAAIGAASSIASAGYKYSVPETSQTSFTTDKVKAGGK